MFLSLDKCRRIDGEKFLHSLVRRSFGGGAQSSKYGMQQLETGPNKYLPYFNTGDTGPIINSRNIY
jgi:hypothetical protein